MSRITRTIIALALAATALAGCSEPTSKAITPIDEPSAVNIGEAHELVAGGTQEVRR